MIHLWKIDYLKTSSITFYLFVHLTTLFRARHTSWSHQKLKNTGQLLIKHITHIEFWKYINSFHFLNLTLPRRWACLWRQDVKNSEFWLRVAPLGLNMIKYFSRRHNLHLLHVSDSIVRSSSPDDIPGYLVGNVFIFQFPDIGAQGSRMLIISII